MAENEEDITQEKVSGHVDSSVGRKNKISFPVDAVFLSAVMEGDVTEMLRLLSTSGDLPDVNKPNHMGMSPLHQSVLQNNLDVTKVLICHGGNVDAQDLNGFSPLHAAAACGSRNMAALLVMFGADLFLATGNGDLPVDLARDVKTSQMLQTAMIQRIHSDIHLLGWCKYYFLEFWTTVSRVSIALFKIIMELIRRYKETSKKWEESQRSKNE